MSYSVTVCTILQSFRDGMHRRDARRTRERHHYGRMRGTAERHRTLLKGGGLEENCNCLR